MHEVQVNKCEHIRVDPCMVRPGGMSHVGSGHMGSPPQPLREEKDIQT